nr:hypothetical protein CFP56_36415 [Quercus suber]
MTLYLGGCAGWIGSVYMAVCPRTLMVDPLRACHVRSLEHLDGTVVLKAAESEKWSECEGTGSYRCPKTVQRRCRRMRLIAHLREALAVCL